VILDVLIDGKLVKLLQFVKAPSRELTLKKEDPPSIGSMVGAVKLVRLMQSLNKDLLDVDLLNRQVSFSNLTVLMHSWYCAAKDWKANAPPDDEEKLHPFLERLLKVTVYNPGDGYV
jgi:hypothetical protein